RALGDEVRIGIAVVDGETGEVLYEKSADEAFVAASNAKLITTAAALALLGPNFQFRTELVGARPAPGGNVPGNLYIRGRGNALFDDADMTRLVRRLKSLGVTRIDGQIIVDNSYFDTENLPPHFDEQPTEQAAFRAPIAATSYNFNSTALYVRPALSGQGPTRVEVRPPNSYVRVTNTSTTVSTGRSHLKMETKEVANRLHIALSGQLRSEVVRRRFRKRIPNPVLFVGTGLLRTLADAGIAVRKKQVQAGKAPESSIVLAVHESPPLATAVRGMGKYSNNFVAELLLKVIGAEVKAAGNPATWQHSVTSVQEFLVTAGMAPDSYRYENGSGLFDSNRFSPRQLTQVLGLALRTPTWGAEFFSSLSIAAVDGTLRGRLENTAAAGLVRGKTGTLDHASALSGLAAIDSRRPLIFSILINGFPETSIGIAQALQDEIAQDLIHALKAR
ncbi:MAG: D-alanyl-D-alanine carboxypeptidase/D-alanyl-D-alanine-endopeptidase, partial [Myxococcales bacterium]|nr:D-alanyl-D-alanine carboxypeptidase/D-alanyl-D-alanine-endopeptidase [Myxococcales bacterium]